MGGVCRAVPRHRRICSQRGGQSQVRPWTPRLHLQRRGQDYVNRLLVFSPRRREQMGPSLMEAPCELVCLGLNLAVSSRLRLLDYSPQWTVWIWTHVARCSDAWPPCIGCKIRGASAHNPPLIVANVHF